MNKQSLDLLEKVFAAEIEGAQRGCGRFFQTKSKLAQQLEADGYLVKDKEILRGRLPVTIEGYRLTLLGNATYCMSERCAGEIEPPNVKLRGADRRPARMLGWAAAHS